MDDHARVQISGDIERQIARMIVKRGDCLRAAEKIKEIAESTSPRSSVDHAHYADAFEVQETTGGARVVNRSRIASILEFGAPGSNIAGRFVLHGAALAAGYKFRKRS
jgi:hypothetical protein